MTSRTVKYSVIIYMILGIGLCIASQILPKTLESGMKNPQPMILLAFGCILILKVLIYYVSKWFHRRHIAQIMETWPDAHAEILDATETGSRYNKQPVVKIVFNVQSPAHGEYQASIRRVVPTDRPGYYSKGRKVTVKENPEKPGKIFLPEEEGGTGYGNENYN